MAAGLADNVHRNTQLPFILSCRLRSDALQAQLDRALQQTMAAGLAARTREAAVTGKLRAALESAQADAAAARRQAEAAAAETAALHERAASLQVRSSAGCGAQYLAGGACRTAILSRSLCAVEWGSRTACLGSAKP